MKLSILFVALFTVSQSFKIPFFHHDEQQETTETKYRRYWASCAETPFCERNLEHQAYDNSTFWYSTRYETAIIDAVEGCVIMELIQQGQIR